MEPTILALLLSAAFIGLLHTLLGPDHYLPFIALGKARRWSTSKVMGVTFLCGIGHILGSVVLGTVGALAGWSLGSLEFIEAARGDIAAWLLTGLGALYLVWAIRQRERGQRHTHAHAHSDGTVHRHEHTHNEGHVHVHVDDSGKRNITFWSLFIIFIFGPCEALIPLLLFPSIAEHWTLAIAVCGVFACATLVTMLAAVYGISRGLTSLRLVQLEPYAHIGAGMTLLACGTVIHLGF